MRKLFIVGVAVLLASTSLANDGDWGALFKGMNQGIAQGAQIGMSLREQSMREQAMRQQQTAHADSNEGISWNEFCLDSLRDKKFITEMDRARKLRNFIFMCFDSR